MFGIIDGTGCWECCFEVNFLCTKMFSTGKIREMNNIFFFWYQKRGYELISWMRVVIKRDGMLFFN